MVIDDNRKRTDLLPRQDIPDAWATKGRCPLCTNFSLKVVHLKGNPDYLLCSPCEFSFEVEMNTGIIRLKNIPEKLGFVEDELRHNWVHPSVFPRLLEERSAIIQKKATAVPKQELTDEIVWERMLGLYRLGNQPKMIEFTLLQSGATQGQIETASLRLKQWAEQDQKQQGQKLWVVAGVTAILIICLVAGGWLFTTNQINSQLAQGRANPATDNQPNLPLQVLNNLPDGIKPEFLKSPPARVERVGPDPTRCPTNATVASQLFGGDSAGWQPGGQPDTWQMITTGKPATIRIPRGMYAGYIDNTTFVFTSADGPATIYNVNFVAISCQ
jgi:hypothetical protein